MSDPATPPNRLIRRRVTRAGACWLGAIAGMWLISLAKGINLLSLLAYWMLILWFLNYLVAGRQLRHLRLRRRADDAAFAGTPFALQVEIENPDAKAHLGLRAD